MYFNMVRTDPLEMDPLTPSDPPPPHTPRSLSLPPTPLSPYLVNESLISSNQIANDFLIPSIITLKCAKGTAT